MKKAISVLLVLVVVCICSVSVMAEDGVMPRYTGISTFSGTVTISGRTVNTSVTGTLWDGYTGKLTAALQERGPDGVWKTVANYTGTASNWGAHLIDQSYTGTPGCSYRAYCVFKAYDASGNLVDDEARYTNVHTV